MRDQQRPDPDRKQRRYRKTQRNLAQIPTEGFLEIIVKERQVVIRNANGDAESNEGSCDDPPAVKSSLRQR